MSTPTTYDLGSVTAYAYAKEKGYTGTLDEFKTMLATFADTAATVKTEAQQVGTDSKSASASASAAKLSETNASSSEKNAKASEANAKTSETNASSSEKNAKASEANAKTSETNARKAADEAVEIPSKFLSEQVVLTTGGWDADTKKQSVTVTGLTAESTVVAAPDVADSTAYVASGIEAVEQGAGSMAFLCSSVPSGDVKVNLLILNL